MFFWEIAKIEITHRASVKNPFGGINILVSSTIQCILSRAVMTNILYSHLLSKNAQVLGLN